jgi:hypothetical protein
MPVIVYSSGRSGTNILLEVLNGSPDLEATTVIETKDVFTARRELGDDYLTKTDTHYTPSPEAQGAFMEQHPDAKIIWAARDPRDHALSKMFRGRVAAGFAADATMVGSYEDMRKMHACYTWLKDHYPDRVMVVKMEDMLQDIEATTQRMCQWLGIRYVPEMCNFVGRVRHEKYSKIYLQLDTERVSLWKNLETAYGGFFHNKEEFRNIESFFHTLEFITKEFDYDVACR